MHVQASGWKRANRAVVGPVLWVGKSFWQSYPEANLLYRVYIPMTTDREGEHVTMTYNHDATRIVGSGTRLEQVHGCWSSRVEIDNGSFHPGYSRNLRSDSRKQKNDRELTLA